MALHDPGLRAARGHAEPRARRHRRAQAAIARRGGEDIAAAIDGAHVRRVERLHPRGLRRGEVAPGRRRAIAAPRVAGRRHPGMRARGIDELPPRVGIRFREQAAHGHVDEFRVAVVALAVGEDELERLGEQVDIGRRVVAERGEVVGLEQRQHLRQHRPLTPGTAREHLVLAKARAHRLLDLHLERGEIVVGQEPALRGVERGDLPRDVAAIEQIARGAKARLPSRLPGPALGVQQAADRARQVGLREDLARFGQASTGHEHGGARRPLCELA